MSIYRKDLTYHEFVRFLDPMDEEDKEKKSHPGQYTGNHTPPLLTATNGKQPDTKDSLHGMRKRVYFCS